MPVVVIAPTGVANFPEGGGHFWVYMQYVEGLRRLGCDVYWLERFAWVERPDRGGAGDPDKAVREAFLSRMESFGMRGRVLLYSGADQKEGGGAPRAWHGWTQSAAEDLIAGADLLLNFHYSMSEALLRRFRRTALVDIDPGLLQFWISRGQLSVPRHDVYFTTGETVGTPEALFPDCGLPWIRIRPPVCLEEWPAVYDPDAEAFTTVSTWSSKNYVVDRDGSYENTKRAAFLPFADLPCLTGQALEMALFLRTNEDARECGDLESRGWRVRASEAVAGTPETYRAYIQRSRGEFSGAKPSCVRFQNAWISDRTICYMASGKPVVVQHTGPSAFLPEGEGMFRVTTPAEAARALAAVNDDYPRHCSAARSLAETHFDARRIAAVILERALP